MRRIFCSLEALPHWVSPPWMKRRRRISAIAEASITITRGEFGFLYSRPYVSLRFGLEILKPTALESTATRSSADLYSVKSDILGYAPKLSLDVNLHSTNTYRSFVSVSGGLANVTMKNQYTANRGGAIAIKHWRSHGRIQRLGNFISGFAGL